MLLLPLAISNGFRIAAYQDVSLLGWTRGTSEPYIALQNKALKRRC
jgi:hypothetical protein